MTKSSLQQTSRWAPFLIFMFMAVHARALPPICYASYYGDDTYNGLTVSTAKQSIMACYDQLPDWGGTIYVLDGGVNGHGVRACKSTDPSGCGIWIMKSRDPNYSHPPAGWRTGKGGVRIIGMAGTSGQQFTRTSQVAVAAGDDSDPSHPAIWLSDAFGMTFENLNFSFPCMGMKIGIDSTGNRVGAGSWNLQFNNVGVQLNHIPGCGPAVDIGSTSSWIFFDNVQLVGNGAETAAIARLSRSSNVTTVTTTSKLPPSWRSNVTLGIVGAKDPSFSGRDLRAKVTGANTFTYLNNGPNTVATEGIASSDQAQAIVLNPGGMNQSSANIISIKNSYFGGGGFRIYGGNTGAGMLDISNILQENGYAPAVHMFGCSSSPYFISADKIIVADAYPIPAVRSECGSNYTNYITVRNATVDGLATLLGGASPWSAWENPLLMGQQGIHNGYVFAQTNAARWGFGPVAARFTNLASPLSSRWRKGPHISFSVGTAPDGTRQATLATSSSSASENVSINSPSQSFVPGGIIICGGWFKFLNPPQEGSNPMQSSCSVLATSPVSAWRIGQGGSQWSMGEWVWAWYAQRLAAVTSAGYIQMSTQVSSTSGVSIYAPVIIYIPPGTMSDNEAAEYAINLQSFRDDATPGQVSLLRGEQFKADSIQVGAGPTITSGVGPPKGSASIGSIYLRRDGSSGSTFYIYEKGGWKAQF